MTQIYQDLVKFHLACVAFGLIMLVIYLFFTQYKRDDFYYIYRIRLCLPLFYMSLACIFLSGFTLWSIKSFMFSTPVAFMFISTLVILLSCIKLFKEFKKARKLKDFALYKRFAAFVLVISILLVLLPCLRLL